jgi:hypothetical protein
MLARTVDVVSEPSASDTVAAGAWHRCSRSLAGSIVDLRQSQLWRRTDRMCSVKPTRFSTVVEMAEDALDNIRVFNTGDDLDRATPSLAGRDFDIERTLQAACLRLIAAR